MAASAGLAGLLYCQLTSMKLLYKGFRGRGHVRKCNPYVMCSGSFFACLKDAAPESVENPRLSRIGSAAEIAEDTA